jgi:hypothetical protein
VYNRFLIYALYFTPFALTPSENLDYFLINAILIFGLTTFSWLRTGMLQSVYETHGVQQG